MPRRRMWLIALCLCLPLALSACPQGGGSPYTLSTLHIAGLRHLPGLASVIDSSTMGYTGVALFQPTGETIPRVLLIINYHLEAVRLDGSNEQQLAPAFQCDGTPAVTADGRWAACLGAEGSSQFGSVEIVSLVSGSSQHHEIKLGNVFSYDPVWSPDGTRLALVAGCSVEVYEASVDYASLDLVASFTSPAFANNSGCHTLAVGWSPDGTRLEIAAHPFQSDSLLVDDHVPVTSPVLASSASVTIPAAQITAIPIGSPFPISDAAWNPRTGTLALISSDSRGEITTLGYYPTAARQVGTWLTSPDSGHLLSRLAWSPDGHQLLLIVNGPSCVDNCTRALPDVYLYTPPAMA